MKSILVIYADRIERVLRGDSLTSRQFQARLANAELDKIGAIGLYTDDEKTLALLRSDNAERAKMIGEMKTVTWEKAE